MRKKNGKSVKRVLKKKKYQNVSKALGLDRLEKATPKTCRERATLIENKLKSGRLPKSLHRKAMLWVHKYRSRAKSLSK